MSCRMLYIVRHQAVLRAQNALCFNKTELNVPSPHKLLVMHTHLKILIKLEVNSSINHFKWQALLVAGPTLPLWIPGQTLSAPTSSY